MKRLVVMGEGQGEYEALPLLVSRVINEKIPAAHGQLFVDSASFKIGEVQSLAARNFAKWHRLLKAAAKRPHIGGILVVLDGDLPKVLGNPFCAARIATQLAEETRIDGAGAVFSVGVVFACREFESWFINRGSLQELNHWPDASCRTAARASIQARRLHPATLSRIHATQRAG
jgi:hypothetical protein